ncbi:MAG: glycosyltransferase family 2 protein [candidate division Zixibacteria bacterium HGW-Zixibacteria-1]|nr:MAG: glycosyltransferase family 2 protein [candidate division Zixibacteria bacterium HGW-Zixibacteria-1]
MSSNNIEISVVLISYNGREFIDDCLRTTLESLESVTFEIIVIDNASSDGTVEIIENKFSQAKLIRNSANLGFAKAVNQGFDAARGEFILLLNQDTRIVGDAVPRLMRRMTDDPAIGAIGPKFIGFDGKLQYSARAFPRYRDLLFEFTGLSYLFKRSKVFAAWKMGWFDHRTEQEVDQPMGAALMTRRDVIEKVGNFDESFGIFFNDVDFCRRVQEAGFINLYFPEAVVEHFVGGSTRQKKARMIIESHRAMYKYFNKYSKTPPGIPLLWFWGGVLYITAYIRAVFSKLF